MNYQIDSVSGLAINIVMTTAIHPTILVKTLIQIGHEPMKPFVTRSIFKGSYYTYPNIFKYLGHIREVDGFFGMYRGITPHLLSIFTRNYCYNAINKEFSARNLYSEKLFNGEIKNQDITDVMRDTGLELISRSLTTILSQPFQVIMVRSMAEFVGRETGYSSGVIGAIKEIYQNDGILGFFSGIVPLLLSEVLLIVMTNLSAHTINEYIVPKVEQIQFFNNMIDFNHDHRPFISILCNMAYGSILYPLKLVSTNIIVKDSKLIAGQISHMPNYTDWMNCYYQLKNVDQTKRGSSMFMRSVPKNYLTDFTIVQ